MRLLKRFFFVGTSTSGTVIFLYKTIKPNEMVINTPVGFIIYLLVSAFFFTLVGALVLLFDYLAKKRINIEDSFDGDDERKGH